MLVADHHRHPRQTGQHRRGNAGAGHVGMHDVDRHALHQLIQATERCQRPVRATVQLEHADPVLRELFSVARQRLHAGAVGSTGGAQVALEAHGVQAACELVGDLLRAAIAGARVAGHREHAHPTRGLRCGGPPHRGLCCRSHDGHAQPRRRLRRGPDAGAPRATRARARSRPGRRRAAARVGRAQRRLRCRYLVLGRAGGAGGVGRRSGRSGSSPAPVAVRCAGRGGVRGLRRVVLPVDRVGRFSRRRVAGIKSSAALSAPVHADAVAALDRRGGAGDTDHVHAGRGADRGRDHPAAGLCQRRLKAGDRRAAGVADGLLQRQRCPVHDRRAGGDRTGLAARAAGTTTRRADRDRVGRAAAGGRRPEPRLAVHAAAGGRGRGRDRERPSARCGRGGPADPGGADSGSSPAERVQRRRGLATASRRHEGRPGRAGAVGGRARARDVDRLGGDTDEAAGRSRRNAAAWLAPRWSCS